MSDVLRRLDELRAWAKPTPEQVVWVLAKRRRRAEARMRLAPAGDSRPELRIYTNYLTRPELVLWFAQVVESWDALDELAEAKKRELIADGWTVKR